MDTLVELERKAHEAECAKEDTKCEYCQDTGVVSKTQWVNEDDSFEVEVKCICNE